jgi:ABC-type Fe3+-hydroxamate transport system substrate-binding protein
LHDSTRLESLGIPTVPVVTAVFQTAARAQASALGRPDFDAVYVDHPIQDQNAQEIAARADAAVAELAARLTAPSLK